MRVNDRRRFYANFSPLATPHARGDRTKMLPELKWLRMYCVLCVCCVRDVCLLCCVALYRWH